MAVDMTANPGMLAEWTAWAFGANSTVVVQLAEIMGINILLSGDNAVVIALACRGLPVEQRKWGIALGVGAAIGLRIIFTLGLQYVIGFPWLMLLGGVLLLWIAIQLMSDSGHGEDDIPTSSTLMGAIRTIALADVVMSLDNVLAIAVAAKGSVWLIVLGLAMSIPLIVFGATLIIGLLNKFPVLVWAGAALLGWLAGELITKEVQLKGFFQGIMDQFALSPDGFHYLMSAIGAVVVLLVGAIIIMRQRNSEPANA
jgi:YjbE family integral membrane protein